MSYNILNKYFIFFSLLLSLNFAKAQLGKEAWHWQFGDSCAIDFSSGTPITSTCAINTNEGSASISDPSTGQLLFYTDGTKVWDRSNAQMPNGFGMIGGQGTSTQAALIVPKPGSSTIYYLISADQGGYMGSNTGVHYSIVDMSLNGGLGNVTIKNQSLTPPPTTEKLTAVKHCNGKDYWIITHPFNSNTFNVYLLTSAGINTTPIVSSIGTTQNNGSGTNQETIGYLKASPNGKKLALGIQQYIPILEIFDFNNSNGQISNPITITYPKYGAYGIAFSPDNYKIYVTIYGTGLLYQYDLSSNSASTIVASQIVIPDSITPYNIGALQLAPNGKIYVGVQDSITLAVINNPNGLGLSCNFKLKGISLPTGTKCFYGLPNFIDANNMFHSQSYNTSLCNFPSYILTASAGTNYQWLNGDTVQSTNVTAYGNYWVSYFTTQGCKEIDTFYVTQAQPPVINILHDTSQCNNSITSVIENATYTNAVSYLWNDGFTSPIHTINNPGNYWVNYTLNNFCISRDSLMYNINTAPSVNLGNDTIFCKGDLLLNAFNSASNYLWNTGQITSTVIASSPTTYWVKVTNQYGCINTDTLVVNPELNAFNFVLPNIVTPNNDGINDFIDFSKYQFSSLQLDIYNRWGNKIFESNDPSCVWKPIDSDGVYFLTGNYIINCGNLVQSNLLKEFITIIR